ncbi:MAG: hypothetical protein ABIG03_01170 [Candidatus Eisenbacteria bacterium]
MALRDRSRRFGTLALVSFIMAAIVGWWMLVDEGFSPARMLIAIVTTVGAALQGVAFARQRSEKRRGG